MKEKEGAVDSSSIKHGCYDVRKEKHWGTCKGREGKAETTLKMFSGTIESHAIL